MTLQVKLVANHHLRNMHLSTISFERTFLCLKHLFLKNYKRGQEIYSVFPTIRRPKVMQKGFAIAIGKWAKRVFGIVGRSCRSRSQHSYLSTGIVLHTFDQRKNRSIANSSQTGSPIVPIGFNGYQTVYPNPRSPFVKKEPLHIALAKPIIQR